MKILFVTHNFRPYCLGGVEIYVHRLAQLLQQRGHAVRVLYPRQLTVGSSGNSVQEGSYEGIPITEVFTGLSHHDAAWLVRNDRIKPLLRRYLAAQPVEVVHVHHLFGLSVSCLDIFEELQIPVILGLHDFWLPCFQMHLIAPKGTVCSGPESLGKCTDCVLGCFRDGSERQRPVFAEFLGKRHSAHQQAMSKPRLVLYPSRFMREVFQRHGFVNRAMVHMPLGIRLFPSESPAPHTMPPVRFAFLGTISHRKGFDLLIDAFRQVDQTQAQLHIHGAVSERSYFDRALQSLAPGSPVAYHGAYQVTDLPRILAAVDVVVIPSRGEAYSLLAREALHGRVPVIAANVGAIPETVQDARNGLLFMENDANDLAIKLNRLVNDPGLIARLRDRIQPVRSIDEDAVALEELYRSVVRSP